MTRARHNQVRRVRRGFALPIVVLLAFVAALAAAVLLDMQSSSRLAVDRQILTYKHHHTAAGVRELVDQWMLIASNNIEGQLDETGMAFELAGQGGNSTRVYLRDAQGAALRDDGGRSQTPGEQSLAQAVSMILSTQVEMARASESEELLRPAGPLQISINSASRRVLEAVVVAAGNPGRAAAFASEVGSRRRNKKLTEADIADVARKAGLTDEQVTAVASMFTANPTLWWLEVVSDRGGSPIGRVRQGGLMQQPSGTMVLGKAGVTILSWDDLSYDQQGFGGR